MDLLFHINDIPLVNLNRMGKRLIGLDYGRGLAIMGLIFCHSIMGGIAGWDTSILFDLASKVPIVLVIIILVPVVFMGMMGSLFSFITAICVTISSIKIHSKGFKYLIQYCIMKIVFAFLLKGIEDFWSDTLTDFDMFKRGRIEFPVAYIHYWAHTLDDVGFFSWTVPLCVAAVTSIPKIHYYGHMAILCALGIVLLYFNEYVLALFETMAKFCQEKEVYLFYYLFMKVADGAFAIGQYFPFALFGGAYGILFSKTRDFKTYWIFTGILSVFLLAGFFRFVFVEKDIVTRSLGWIKPTCFLYLMGIVQAVAMIFVMHFTDNPKRNIQKRYRAVKRTTFLRRINCLSLTAYIAEGAYCKTMYVIFKVFFGNGADTEQGTMIWPWYIVLLYMVVCVWVWCLLVKLWEKAEFRFCAEQQLSVIMSWLFKQPYNKMDYKNAIYGPINELQQEIERMNKETTTVVEIASSPSTEPTVNTDIPPSETN